MTSAVGGDVKAIKVRSFGHHVVQLGTGCPELVLVLIVCNMMKVVVAYICNVCWHLMGHECVYCCGYENGIFKEIFLRKCYEDSISLMLFICRIWNLQ